MRFGHGKDAKNPNWNTLNYKHTHVWSKGRMTAGIAHSGYYNSNGYAVCCVLASAGEAWHSVLHLCIVLPGSRNRQKQTMGNKVVLRPLVLSSSLQRLCKAKKKRLRAPPPDMPTLHTVWCMQTVNDKYSESSSTAHTGGWTLTGNILQMMYKSFDMPYTTHYARNIIGSSAVNAYSKHTSLMSLKHVFFFSSLSSDLQTLGLRSSLELRLADHRAMALIFQLEYVFSAPFGQELMVGVLTDGDQNWILVHK